MVAERALLVFKLFFFNWKRRRLPNEAKIFRRTTRTRGGWVAPGECALASTLVPGLLAGDRAAGSGLQETL